MTGFVAIVATLALFAGLAAAFWGWGWVAALALRRAGAPPLPAALSIWLGWAALLFGLQVVNLFAPITAVTVIPLFLIGILLALRPMQAALRSLGKNDFIFGIIFAAAILALAVWVSVRAMLPAMNYDTGVYHFAAVRWINSYAVVPGLGNLHGRLAFNQSFMTYVAALNFYPLFGHGDALANSFLLLLTFATLLAALRPVFQRPALLLEAHPFLYAAPLVMLPLLGFLTVISRELSSPTPDLASTLLQIVMAYLLARGIALWVRGETWRASEIAVLVILAATAVTVKLSNAAFAGGILVLCLAYTWRASPARWKSLAGILLPAFAVVAVWGFRGFLLSGAPFYPSTIGYIPVSWAVPLGLIKEQAISVSAWGRLPHGTPDVVMSNWDWLGPWSAATFSDSVGVVYPLVSTLIFGVAGLAATMVSIRRKRGGFRLLEWSLVLLPMVGLAFWFFTSPDPRFANALFFLLAYGAALLVLCALLPLLSRRGFAVVLVVILVAANFFLVKYAIGRYSYKDISLSGWQPETTVPLVEKWTTSGLGVYTPADGGDQCWDAPLPCTPYFNQDLRLRVPGDLGAGFMVGNGP